MGLTNLFVCDDCGYSAEVAGGRDYGGVSHVQTMAYTACRELVDVVVATDWPQDPERVEAIGRCLRCRSSDDLAPWGQSQAFPAPGAAHRHPVWGPCPGCGGAVRFSASIGIWDG